MNAPRKFDFAVSFDEDDPQSTPGAGDDRSSRANAKIMEAHEKGRQAGLAEAQATIERQSAAAAEAIGQGLSNLEATRAAIESEMSRQAVEMATTLIGKVLPALARREAMGEVQAMVKECLARVLDEPRVVVRVHDSLLDSLQARIDALVQESGYAGQVVLLAETGLGPSDCRVEWANGGADRDMNSVWREIEAVIQRSFSTPGGEGTQTAAVGTPTNADNNEHKE